MWTSRGQVAVTLAAVGLVTMAALAALAVASGPSRPPSAPASGPAPRSASVGPAHAGSAQAPTYEMRIDQEHFDPAGNPVLVANFSPDSGLATPTWSLCPPGGAACQPTGVKSQVLEPGPTEAGTTFEATVTYKGVTYRARSSPWLGRLTATSRPRLEGEARVGARVTPVAGEWSGGWGDEGNVLSVVACRPRDMRDCVTIAHPWVLGGFRGRIDPRWSGYYLFAYDVREPADAIHPAIGYVVPQAIAVPPLSAMVARSEPLGPVRGPSLRLRRRARRLPNGRLAIGHVRCARGCRVAVSVRDLYGRRPFQQAQTTVHGSATLVVREPGLRYPDGPIIARVRVGSAPVVREQIPVARR